MRHPYVMVLCDVLPAQVPDVDAVFQASDYPCVPQRKAGELLAPVLGFDSAPGQAEIPFPDFSYYGKELRALRGEAQPAWSGSSAAGRGPGRPRPLHGGPRPRPARGA